MQKKSDKKSIYSTDIKFQKVNSDRSLATKNKLVVAQNMYTSWGETLQRAQGSFGVMDMSTILIVEMVLWLYTYVKIHQIVCDM
jgi:hypothetical protein